MPRGFIPESAKVLSPVADILAWRGLAKNAFREPWVAKNLRVLIVENNERDLRLIIARLRLGDYVIDHHCVASAAAMRAAIEQAPWDIVISVWAMPEFSGVEALNILAERGLAVPFILCAGALGVDAAVEMMKRGAHDYVSKANLGRLLPAVARALGDTRLRSRGTVDPSVTAIAGFGGEDVMPNLDDANCGRNMNARGRNDQGYFQAQSGS